MEELESPASELEKLVGKHWQWFHEFITETTPLGELGYLLAANPYVFAYAIEEMKEDLWENRSRFSDALKELEEKRFLDLRSEFTLLAKRANRCVRTINRAREFACDHENRLLKQFDLEDLVESFVKEMFSTLSKIKAYLNNEHGDHDE